MKYTMYRNCGISLILTFAVSHSASADEFEFGPTRSVPSDPIPFSFRYKNCNEAPLTITKKTVIATSNDYELNKSARITGRIPAGVDKSSLEVSLASSYTKRYGESQKVELLEERTIPPWKTAKYTGEIVETWKHGKAKYGGIGGYFFKKEIKYKAIESIDFTSIEMNGTEACCEKRKLDTKRVPITTSKANARLLAGKDKDIHSDDKTRVNMEYSIDFTDDQTRLELNIVWTATELESDGKTTQDTVIVSKRNVEIPIIDIAECTGAKIAYVEGVIQKAEAEEVYDNKVHEMTPFPWFGSLTNIKVQFDSDDSDDTQSQNMRAMLSKFTVVMK